MFLSLIRNRLEHKVSLAEASPQRIGQEPVLSPEVNFADSPDRDHGSHVPTQHTCVKYAYIYTYIYVYIHMYVFICAYVYKHAPKATHTHIYIYIRIYIYACTDKYTVNHMYIFKGICICICRCTNLQASLSYAKIPYPSLSPPPMQLLSVDL